MPEFDNLSMQVLREICMDSRETIADMARKLKCSRNAIKRRLNFLEDELQLKYVAEFDERELGLVYNYIIRVQLKKSLDKGVLLGYLKRDPVAQFAVFTKGDFDLVIYATAKTHIEYCRWEYWMRYLLKDHIASWKSANFLASRFGFFPLHENILSTIDIPSPRKEIVALLNNNSRMSLKELAGRVKLSHPTTRYHVAYLEKSKYVKKFTTIMQRPPKPTHLIMFMTYNFAEGFESRNERVREMLLTESDPVTINKCSFVASVAGTADDFVIMSFDELEEALELTTAIEKIEKEGEVRIESAVVAQVVYGAISFRNMDTKKVYDTAWDIYGKIYNEGKQEVQMNYPEKTKLIGYLNEFVDRWHTVMVPQLAAALRDKKPYVDVTDYFKNTKSKVLGNELKEGKCVYAICFENARGMVNKFELNENKTIKRDEYGKWKIDINPSMLAMVVLDLFVPFICSDEILPLNRKRERPYGLDAKKIAKIIAHIGRNPRRDLVFFITETPEKIGETSRIFLREFMRLVSGEYSKKAEVGGFIRPMRDYTPNKKLFEMANELIGQYVS